MTVTKLAKPGDQKGNHSGSNRRGEQHAQPVAVGQQPRGDGPQQSQSSCKWDDYGDDRDHRAQCAHDRSLCQLARA